jgi:hypothetical protein
MGKPRQRSPAEWRAEAQRYKHELAILQKQHDRLRTAFGQLAAANLKLLAEREGKKE